MSNSIAVEDLVPLVSGGVSGTQYCEIRYQSRIINEVSYSNGDLERIRNISNSGFGIRTLVDGCWGFSSTFESSKHSLKKSLLDAISSARSLTSQKKIKVKGLAKIKPVRGTFRTEASADPEGIDIENKIKITKEADMLARKFSSVIKSTSSVYREIIDRKLIVNSDGVQVEILDSKPEFTVSAIAIVGENSVVASEGIGITGGWYDLFSRKDHLDYAALASQKAASLISAKHASGEKTSIILDPGLVGLIAHEAVGHMVEADFVLSGSIVKDKQGQKVASDLITLVDSGRSDFKNHAAGTILIDDEGVLAEPTVIIERGILKSFLHNRESAFVFDAPPTGNARAFEYNDEPIIRMRNTFVEPGEDKFEDLIKETKHGYLLKGARNGQADANGEFMFGSQEAYLIENGEIKELLRGASISGNAFEVLHSVDMIGKEFQYDIGTGYCGKYQPAKVDGGGPPLRCTAIIGGLQG